MSDTMNTAAARWIGRRVEYRRVTDTGTITTPGVIIDFTPAELLVQFDNDGGVLWVSGDDIGGNLVVIDGEPAFEVGDAVSWTSYFGNHEVVGFIVTSDSSDDRLGGHPAHVVRDIDGNTFRVAADRIHHRAVPAPDTQPEPARITRNDGYGRGVTIDTRPTGVVFSVFDNRTGREIDVELGFGTTAEIAAWLRDQMHANDHTAR